MAIPAFCLDLEQITKVISCGNLMTYSFVTACGVALRFRDRDTQTTVRAPEEKWVWAYLLFSFISAMSLMQEAPAYVTYSLGGITFLILIRLCFVEQKNRPRKGHYTMPWVPILPAIGIYFNFMLSCTLDATTWMYFGVFLSFGLLIYFSYGMWHSKLEAENVYRGEIEVSLTDNGVNRLDHAEEMRQLENRYMPPTFGGLRPENSDRDDSGHEDSNSGRNS